MISKILLMTGLLVLLVTSSYTFAAVVGTASITAPAVITGSGSGSLTEINLTVTNGNGNVSITGVPIVGNDTVQSAITAAHYAASYSNLNFSNYNFNYKISTQSDNVSGPSAGAAMTILAVSALTHQQIRSNFTMTGTISSNGSIGEIGGVYDKTAAAAQDGFKFILVPAVRQSNGENALYALVQANFGIPLVQVSNITQAANYAFNPSAVPTNTTYTPYTDYHVSQLPVATLTCSNACNTTAFGMLVNQTFAFTNGEIAQLSQIPGFTGISAQLAMVLNQSEAVAGSNYLYTAADLSFLDYIDAYYFNNHAATKSSTLNAMMNTENYCLSLTPPQLTSNNYEDVISGELRQAWANYTISTAIGTYNATSEDTDGVLTNVYTAGEAYAWCHASSVIYGIYANSTGYLVSQSPALKTVAFNRLGRGAAYGPNLYTSSAQVAYNQGNYPVAILDSDYAYAFGIADLKLNLGTGALDNLSLQTIKNATYGVWATEFAKESQFYVSQSQLTSNSTLANGYATQAYSTSVLAQQISNDTMVIHNNLIPISEPQSGLDTAKIIRYINSVEAIVLAILVVVIVLLIITLALLIGVIMVLHGHVKNTTVHTSKRRTARKTRRTRKKR